MLCVEVLKPGVFRILRKTEEEYDSWAVVWKETPIAVVEKGAKIIEDAKVGVSDDLVRILCKGFEFRELSFKRLRKGFIWEHFVPSDYALYGFGEKGGPLNKRFWKRMKLKNRDPSVKYRNPDIDPLYLNIPFYIMASPGKPAVGVFLDNTYPMDIEPPKMGEVLRIKAKGGPFAAYIIIADDVKGVLEAYTELTGRMPLPPLWSLGYHQSKWSYTFEEALEIVRKFRELGIPIDAIYFDIDYMDSYKIFTWSPKYKEPKKRIEELHKMGCKVVVIVDPYVKIERGYRVFEEGLKNDYFVKDKKGRVFKAYGWPGSSAIPDLTKEDVRRWWGSLYAEFAKEYNIDGFWNDMNEPTLDIRPIISRLRRYNLLFYNKGRMTSLDKNGNVFPLLENMATYEGLRKEFNKRFFILSRSGYAGLQRYAANWTGDVWSTWEHLRRSVTMILGLGLSGIPFAGADIGGYAPPLKKTEKTLYIRWIQLGTFYPFMRVHYMKRKKPQEPYTFDDEVLEISRKFIRLRYQLLPYIYTVFYESHQKGYPIARPLFFEFPDDERAYKFEEEFMFGPWLLVVPVLRKDGLVEYYLPKGRWLNFWTHSIFESDGVLRRENVPLDRIPLFVREGAIIPMQEPLNYVGEKEIREIELLVFPSHSKTEWFIYEDDGETYNYERGEYNLIRIIASKEGLEFIPETKGFKSSIKNIVVKMFGVPKPARVLMNGEPIEFSYDGTLTFKLAYPTEGKVTIE